MHSELRMPIRKSFVSMKRQNDRDLSHLRLTTDAHENVLLDNKKFDFL